MSMTFKLFKELYGEAMEATDLDHYIMERGWQEEWMSGMPLDTITTILKKTYKLAKAPDKWKEIKGCFPSLKALSDYIGVPYSTLQKWSIGASKPTNYILLILSFIVINDMIETKEDK